jgi:Asp-tRNA(Asn)/Glu-tRNA(Gln) amidotransferase A subunit family amidase
MREPAAAVHEYLRDSRPAAEPELPKQLTLPLRQRIELVQAGQLSTEDFYAAADAWSSFADARYRACVQWRPSAPGAAPVRLGVKDTVDVAGFPTRLGLRRYRHHPTRSAAALAGLRHATVNAKVVTTELNIGIGSGCVNPYFPRFSPAGSSTGSAVAVAAGICDLSLGTDVLGSVRWPAGRCGVVGLRVTHNDRWLPGIFPLSPPMDAPGWVARTADDLAFLWSYLGLDAEPEHAPPPTGGPVRIGIVEEVLDGEVEAEIRDALRTGAQALAARGHTIVPVRVGELWNWRAAAWELCARQAWDGYQVWRDQIADDLLPSTVRALTEGERVGDERYAEIRGALARLRAGAAGLFAAEQVAAWLLPLDPDVPRPAGTAVPAASSIPNPGEPGYDREVGYTPVASFAGLPALTFPVGRSPATGAPLALQLVGPPLAERTLIRLACDAALELGDLGLLPG